MRHYKLGDIIGVGYDLAIVIGTFREEGFDNGRDGVFLDDFGRCFIGFGFNKNPIKVNELSRNIILKLIGAVDESLRDDILNSRPWMTF